MRLGRTAAPATGVPVTSNTVSDGRRASVLEATLGRRTGTGKDVVAELLDGELSHFLAGGKMSGELSNGDIVRLFYDGWNSGDINFGDLVAEDIVNHQPEAEPERV